MTSMKRIISQVNRATPLSKLVWVGCSDDRLGHARRDRCLEPVSTITAVAVPLSTLVPRKADVLRVPAAIGSAARRCRVELLDREATRRSARLDDEQVLARDDAEIGRDHVAGRQLDHVAGDQL